MYRILLVDDEPIILSGLQSMLRWEEYGCTVVGTARNGSQAMELIRRQTPDIVICDINMPVLTGLELLTQCSGEFPALVFIMLTNYEDFGMARESLRNRAVDYLLKIDLDDEKLAHSLQLAIQEHEKRRKLYAAPASAGPEAPSDDPLPSQVRLLLSPSSGEGAQRAAAFLAGRGMASHCAAALLVLDPARIPNIGGFSPEEKARLFQFHQQLAQDMAQKLFSGVGYLMLPPAPGGGAIPFFFWGLDSTEPLRRFHDRLTAALGDISQMQLSLLTTEIVSGGDLADLRFQLATLRGEYDICPQPFLQYTPSMGKIDYVEAARHYVESHILERISVQDAAAAIGITPNYLSALFKRQLGRNFVDYVNAIKVEYACTLLKSGKHLVYEISHTLGYDNAYYFTKVFKRYTGVTPSEYQTLSQAEG